MLDDYFLSVDEEKPLAIFYMTTSGEEGIIPIDTLSDLETMTTERALEYVEEFEKLIKKLKEVT